MVDFQKLLADTLRSIRTKNRMTQQDVAEKLGVKKQTYSEYERKAIPRLDKFCDIAEALGMKPSQLMAEIERNEKMRKGYHSFDFEDDYLEDAIDEFLDSCERQGYFDAENNWHYFYNENAKILRDSHIPKKVAQGLFFREVMRRQSEDIDGEE